VGDEERIGATKRDFLGAQEMKQPRILFCLSGGKPDPSLGAGKVSHVIMDGLTKLGWQCEFVDPLEMAPAQRRNSLSHLDRCRFLRAAILNRQHEFDVIEYDFSFLPFSRSEFSPHVLMVARSVLFGPHLRTIHFPEKLKLISSVKRGLLKWFELSKQPTLLECCGKTMANTDLLNVTCPEDVVEAQRMGVPAERILQLPYGLTKEEHDELGQIPKADDKCHRVLFLGTFDWRKGAADLLKTFQRIAEAVPDVTLRLAGTKGLFQTESEVRSLFAKGLQSKIEVIPRFARSELPLILHGCAAGVFPSYLEGWPFSIAEQMAGGVPVVAYNAPGASMQLPVSCLVERGDWRGMADKLIDWLKNPATRNNARLEQKQMVIGFSWGPIISATNRLYRERLAKPETPISIDCNVS
jgi:glycosyltransferase involved in cell wall biosynthesis